MSTRYLRAAARGLHDAGKAEGRSHPREREEGAQGCGQDGGRTGPPTANMNTIHIGQPWTTHLALHLSLTHNIRLISSHQEKRNSCLSPFSAKTSSLRVSSGGSFAGTFASLYEQKQDQKWPCFLCSLDFRSPIYYKIHSVPSVTSQRISLDIMGALIEYVTLLSGEGRVFYLRRNYEGNNHHERRDMIWPRQAR